MNRYRLLVVTALAVLSGCAKSSDPAQGSQTHFLAACEDSCPAPYDCLCGVCTLECDGDRACSAASSAAQCLAPDDQCGVANVCDVECTDDGDCAALSADHACERGHCRAPSAGRADAGNDGSVAPSFEAAPDCESDNDCVDSNLTYRCVHFGAEGPSACRVEAQPPLDCESAMGPQDCCSDEDCPGGRCLSVFEGPYECSTPMAGGNIVNRCFADACSSDDECADGTACAPAGFDNARSCISAACRTSSDCDDEPGGVCLVISNGCCGLGAGPLRPAELGCAYPSDGCQRDDDCGEGAFCNVSAGRARCETSCAE